MAEVGQRLWSGVHRLAALKNSQGRPVSSGDSPAALRVKCSVSDRRVPTEPEPKHSESQTVSRLNLNQHLQENGSLLCAAALEVKSLRFSRFAQTREKIQAHRRALHRTARHQPFLQEKPLPLRRTSWTREAVSIHPDNFISFNQQLRTVCTVFFILTEQQKSGFGQRLRIVKLHPHPSTSARSYSWRSGRSSNDAPLYRSRTAYYDILKVSPGATQSQIKTAYYKQSFVYHPDKNQGDKEASRHFTEISEAYTVLGNISLRRKYDLGILNQLDVQGAGRPSSKEATSRSTGSTQQQHQHQDRRRQFSQSGSKTMFDFDAFYQAHYGEQLQREKNMRARKERMQEKQKENIGRWAKSKMMEMTVVTMVSVAGLIFLNLSRP